MMALSDPPWDEHTAHVSSWPYTDGRVRQVRVTLGEYVLKSSAEPLPGRTYGVSKIKVHPYFKFTPQADR